ncbi:MAG TPA: ATP-binding protein [Bacteroidales bacterium]|nr:ATP-binding protein [Bacteroidales bacterium]
MQKLKFEYKFTAIYILLGCLWITFSDKILAALVTDPDLQTTFQTYKGWFYVIVTSVLFYFILKSHLTKQRNAELKAKESDLLKTAFLRNISHEIRTPMNSIIGFSSLLNEDNIPDSRKSEYLRIINSSSNQLLNIVNEILDISLIETGNLNVIEKKVNLNKLIDEVYQYFRPLMRNSIDFSQKKGLDDEHCNILTDELKVRKVLSNMINNALKFTERGHISFGYETDGNELKFFVEDTGIGIPGKFIPSLFNRFEKAEFNQGKFYEGLGLGLSICKGNIDLLNGKIWVDSEAGKGSKFFFTIPYKPVI